MKYRAMASILTAVAVVTGVTALPPAVAAPARVSAVTVSVDDTADYVLEAPTFSTAAGVRDSTDSYRMDWTMGELAVAAGASPSYQVVFGFLPGCGCPCHGDPQCDGVSNVLDVVIAVNVAFRSATPATDPDCPYEQTDVSCDGYTNVIDVVKFVNVTFRGGDPGTEFCEPCGS